MNIYQSPGFGGMFGFDMFSIMFAIVFFLVIGTFLVTLVKSVGEWSRNNQSPKLTVPATIVAKRINVRRSGANGHRHASTTYYVTFQVESGDRMELRMTGSEYGLLVEGDRGNLSFQGTRYIGFSRI